MKHLYSLIIALLLSVSVSASQEHSVLLISIDGFMPEYFERTETPHFDWIKEQGVSAEYMIPVFPTMTFTNHYSIVTGMYPENHGILSNTMYDPEWDATFSLGNRDEIVKGRWYEAEPLWVTAEKQGVGTASMFWVGSEAEISGIRPSRWYPYDGSLPYKQRVDSVVTWLSSAPGERPGFVTLYFSKPDSYGHRYGPDSDEMTAAIAEMDEVIGYLLEEFRVHGLNEHTNILFVSDHGMAALSEEKLIFLDEVIDLGDVRVVGWGAVAMIVPEDGKKEEVYEALKSSEQHYRVYKKDQLPEEFRIGSHRRTPPIIMVADLPWSITSRPFFERRGILAGNHGWDHREPAMRTIFMAMGPDIVSGKTIPPFELTHIYELVCELLGLEPAENDGSLEVLKGILRESK
ncbi:ectonucleotide pyrophosphatase/phosphodiesterase [Balneolaceae bacterium ANBcel3]|nr:ectonucleotide pyrophosphatase/phosphodiesterase [Balneolaceae bacterium ANBcel3]